MSIIESKTILFIKSPSHNIRSVEHFLQKKDFRVWSEEDFETALDAARLAVVPGAHHNALAVLAWLESFAATNLPPAKPAP